MAATPFRHPRSLFRHHSVTRIVKHSATLPSPFPATLIVVDISILRKKVAEKPKKIKFLLEILRHFSTPAGPTTPVTGKVCIYSKKNHFDAFSKPFRCLWKVIAMFL
jgi:hypothetical protein